MYAIAVMYLSNSFQLSLNICKSDLKTRVKSDIYQANILRFKALNLEQFALKTDPETVDDDRSKSAILEEATHDVGKAYKIYKAKEAQTPSLHGMALAAFQMGHIY